MSPAVPAAHELAAWSWTQHLRDGGVTPWSVWRASRPSPEAPPAGWAPAGAAQLELVRRLAERELLAGPGFAELADLVLSRSGPGRGLAQQPLAWPEQQPGVRRFGAPPADPSDVPVQELVRIAVGVLTELLLAAPPEPRRGTSVRRRPFARTPAFELAGAPVTTSAVRRDLAAAGHGEGGRSPQVVLLAEPFDQLLAQVWSVRVQRGAAVRWRGFVSRWAARPTLPPSADLPGLARLCAERVGSTNVHVVVAPASPTGVVADLLGLRLRTTRSDVVARWHDLSPAAVDVGRRVNGVLGVRVPDERRTAPVGSLVDVLREVSASGTLLTVPETQQPWARRRAERMAEQLTAGGYPVHGRLEDLAPVAGLPTRPHPAEVLGVVEAGCLVQAQRNQRRRAEAT